MHDRHRQNEYKIKEETVNSDLIHCVTLEPPTCVEAVHYVFGFYIEILVIRISKFWYQRFS